MTLLLVMPFSLVMWLIMSFTSTLWVLQLMRTLLGVSQGIVGTASTNYLAEVTHSTVRGRLMSVLDMGRQTGILLVYIVGCMNLTWREIMLVCGCVSTLPTFIGLLFIPNSPRWLVTQSREEEAYESLVFLRGPHYDSKKELQSIVDHFQKATANTKSTMEQMKQMQEPNVLYRLVLMTVITILVQFSGNISIVTYCVPIFQAANSTMNSYGSAVSIASLRVAGIFVFMLLVERLGRRILMVTSSLLCTISLLFIGVFFMLKNTGSDVSTIGWLPLISLLVYMPFVVSITAVTAVLRSEMFATSIRAMAVSIMFAVFFLSMFAVTQFFPNMMETLGEQGTFWTYSISCLLLALVTVLLLPETSGLTLEEVDDTFKYGKKIVVPIPCV